MCLRCLPCPHALCKISSLISKSGRQSSLHPQLLQQETAFRWIRVRLAHSQWQKHKEITDLEGSPLSYKTQLPCLHFLLFLNRKLGMAGQKLGSSALLCYIRPDTADPTGSFSLTVANVGTCQAVLCRSGKPVPLSKVFSLEQELEEAQRVKGQKAIVTEVSLAPHQSLLLPRSRE